MIKYNNRKTVRSGITFDSSKEAAHFMKLKALEQAGKITNLQLQVKFELIAAQYKHFQIQGKRKMLDRKECVEKSCNYYADFTYHKDGVFIVVDVKGMKTEAYKIKKKLMLQKFGIAITEV